MSIWIALSFAISAFAMFYGVRRMGDVPQWNVISGFVVLMAGVIGFVITLFAWLT